jgi:hypothetical protein
MLEVFSGLPDEVADVLDWSLSFATMETACTCQGMLTPPVCDKSTAASCKSIISKGGR